MITGWFAEFDDLTGHHEPHAVTYGPPSTRFASGTYDPASHYRAGRVLEFFEAHGLRAGVPPHRLPAPAAGARRRRSTPSTCPLPSWRGTATVPVDWLAGFLSLRAPDAGQLQQQLRARGVFTDSRADRLRVGPAPYLSDAQLTDAIAVLGDVAGRPR